MESDAEIHDQAQSKLWDHLKGRAGEAIVSACLLADPSLGVWDAETASCENPNQTPNMLNSVHTLDEHWIVGDSHT